MNKASRQAQTGVSKKRIYLYLDPKEIGDLKAAAARENKSVSKWIHDEIIEKLDRHLKLDLENGSE